jgi:hypothetical protein
VSKTDKTKPWAIRVMEHQPWANHDHSDGICDLPEHYKDNAYYGTASGAGHCRWSDWNICYRGNCCYGCGCRYCAGQAWRRTDRRRSRHLARHEARRVLVEADWDGWMVPDLPSSW